MYTMFVASSVLFLQSSRNTLAIAPTIVSENTLISICVDGQKVI